MNPSHPLILLAVSYVVSTIAGIPGTSGQIDGPVSIATFDGPTAVDVMVDADCTDPGEPGDIYVVDRANNAVRRISNGQVSTFEPLAGVNLPAYKLDFGDRFGGGIMIEPDGSGCGCMEWDRGLYVASTGTRQVPEFSFNGMYTNRDGTLIIGANDKPPLNMPAALARSVYYTGVPPISDPTDRVRYRFLYIADAGDHTIRRVAFSLDSQACPQSHDPVVFAGALNVPGAADGVAQSARFNTPRGIVAAPDGSVYVADTGNHSIRRISSDGTVSTVAGDPGEVGSNDGSARAAHFKGPTGLALNSKGELYIADTGNNTIRMLKTDGTVVTVAGSPGLPTFADGQGQNARFSSPTGLHIAPDDSVIVADTGNHAIRRITPSKPLPRRRAVRR